MGYSPRDCKELVVTNTFTVTFQRLRLLWLLEQSATVWQIYTHKMITPHCSGGYRSETGRRDGQVPVNASCLVVEGELTRLCSHAEGMRDLSEVPFTKGTNPTHQGSTLMT